MVTLRNSTPHFVRCMKPNADKVKEVELGTAGGRGHGEAGGMSGARERVGDFVYPAHVCVVVCRWAMCSMRA